MTLSGSIESFPLAEVLRLAARSRQSGLLRVESGGTHGRVYFTDGLLTYATTRDQDDLGGDLGRLEMIDPHRWYPVERGEEPISSALVDGVDESAIRRFLGDRVADVLVRLLRSRHGRFDFSENTEPTYLTGQRFEIEEVLRGVEVRVREWSEIEAVIPVDDATIHLSRDLGGRQDVTLDGDTWRIIAALASASSVDGVADITGLSDFVVARAMADLVTQGLLQVRMATSPKRGVEEETEVVAPPPESEPAEPITVGPATGPSIVDRALAADGAPIPAPEEGGIVEFTPTADERSETAGW